MKSLFASFLLALMLVTQPAQASWLTDLISTVFFVPPDSSACQPCEDLKAKLRKQCTGSPVLDSGPMRDCQTFYEMGQCVQRCYYDTWSSGGCVMVGTNALCAKSVRTPTCTVKSMDFGCDIDPTRLPSPG